MGEHRVQGVGEFTVHEHTRDGQSSVFYLTTDDMGCMLTEPVEGRGELKREIQRLKRMLDRAGRG